MAVVTEVTGLNAVELYKSPTPEWARGDDLSNRDLSQFVTVTSPGITLVDPTKR